MALVNCGECDNQVSTAAACCPKCGAPVGSQGIRTPLATVQRTSKPLKAQGCLSAIVLCIGVVVLVAATSSDAPSGGGVAVGMILTLIGLGWAVVTRIRIWWHHD